MLIALIWQDKQLGCRSMNASKLENARAANGTKEVEKSGARHAI
jgi:hypothetical protein